MFSPDPEQAYNYHQRLLEVCPRLEQMNNRDVMMAQEGAFEEVGHCGFHIPSFSCPVLDRERMSRLT